MRKRLWIVISVIAAAAIFVLAWRGHHRTATVEAAPGPPAAQVAPVQRGDIAQVLTLAGQFQPYQVVDVHPKVSGFIRHIYVDIGDRVHQGQALAVLEVPELKAQLQGTVSEVARSNDEIVRAQHEVRRAESMHGSLHADYQRLLDTSKAQPGLVAQQELDNAQSKDLASEADVDAAKAALAAAQKGMEVSRADNARVGAIADYTNVIAPLDGVIVWRYADTGALIQSGTGSDSQSLPIVRLSQSELLRLRVPVPEDDVQYVHIGEPMQVRVDAVGRSFTGKVVRFTRDVAASTRTMETEIDVKNPDLTLDPGMYANTQLQLGHVANVPTVPVEAILNSASGDEVYALDSGNQIHIRPVKTGFQGSLLVQVTEGLQPGDRVIVGGLSKYHDGEVVSPIMTKQPTSDTERAQGSMVDLHNEQGGAQ